MTTGVMLTEHPEAPVPQANGSVPIFLRVRSFIAGVGVLIISCVALHHGYLPTPPDSTARIRYVNLNILYRYVTEHP